jgi:hypothetical protein
MFSGKCLITRKRRRQAWVRKPDRESVQFNRRTLAPVLYRHQVTTMRLASRDSNRFSRNSAALPRAERPRLRKWGMFAAAVALQISVASAAAQTVTLPTVRAFGPGPEEAMLQRLVHEMREDYVKDTITLHGTAASTERDQARNHALRVLGRLDALLLAGVTHKQFNELLSAKDSTDSLLVLAGERHLPDDPLPRDILQAIRTVSDDQTACFALGAITHARLTMQGYQEVKALVEQIRVGVGDSADVRRRHVNVACVVEEMQERAPARSLAAAVAHERTANRPQRAMKLDTLMRAATAVVILRKLSTRTLAPVTSREQAAAFWRQRGIAPLNVGSVAGSGKSGVAFTELASPLLQVVRVSVNAVLAAEKKEKATGTAATPAARQTAEVSARAIAAEPEKPSAEIQRLLTGGGLFNVNFAWPALFRDWNDGSVDVMGLVVPRFGLTAPVLGASSVDTTTLNADLGLELHGKVLDLIDGVGTVAQFRWAYATGARGYMESLGVSGHGVTYLTASFGFLFGRQYLVTASRALGGPKMIRQMPWQVGVTVVRLPTAP